MKAGISKNLLWSALSSGTNFLLQILVIAFLTRQLNPAEYGRISILLVAYGFFQVFMDFGLSNYIISKREVTYREFNNVFWINLILGICIGLMVMLLSESLSIFYNDPSLSTLLKGISFSMFFLPFYRFYYTVLQKNALFKYIGIGESISKILWAVVILALLWAGFKAEVVVYAIFTQVVFNAIFMWSKAKVFFVPNIFIFSVPDRKMFAYGAYQIGELVFNFLSREIDKIIVGRVMGMENLGIYSVYRDLSFRFGSLVSSTLSRVYFTYLSSNQNVIESVRKIYREYTILVISILFVGYLGLSLFGEILFGVIINEEFIYHSDLLIPFCFLCLIRFSLAPVGTLWLGMNRPEIGLKWNLFSFITLPFAVYFGAQQGMIVLTYSLIVLYLVYFLLSYLIIYHLLEIKFWNHISFVLPLLVVFLIVEIFTNGPPQIQLVTLLGYLASLILLGLLVYLHDSKLFLGVFNKIIKKQVK